MAKTPGEIWEYVKTNNPEYWSMSPTAIAQKSQEVLFEAMQWDEYRRDVGEIKDVLNGTTSKEWTAFDKMMGDSSTTSKKWNSLSADNKAALQEIFMKEFNSSGDANKAAEAVRKSKLYKETFGSSTDTKAKNDKSKDTDKNKKSTNTNSSNKTATVVKTSGWQSNATYHWKK